MLSVVGKSIPRPDAVEKVTGQAKYSADFSMAGMCYGKLLRSPYPHARIVRIDVSKAQKLPGVKAIVTGKDAPLIGEFIMDRYVIARDVVRYVGEPVAGVVAESEEVAEEALELIDVAYEELPPVFNVEEAFKVESPVIIHPNLSRYQKNPLSFRYQLMPDNRPNVFECWKGYQGDVQRGFQEADLVVENKFTVCRWQHAALERYIVDAWLEANGQIVVREKRQGIHPARSALSSIYHVPLSKVRVIVPYIGGTFGEAIYQWPESVAVLLALRSGVPVRLSFNRDECFVNILHSLGEVIYIKDGVKKNGAIIARQLTTLLDAGAYSGMSTLLVRSGVRGAVGQYRIPNFEMESYGIYTNLPVTGAMRGVTNPQLIWAVEQQMDIIAEKLGIDPVEIRKKNLLKEGERHPLGEITHSIGAEECMNRVTEWLGQGKSPEVEGALWRKGKGFAVGNLFTTADLPSFATVKIYGDGMVEVHHGSEELGQGINTVLAQIAAEEFAIPVENVMVVRGDTAVTPYDSVTCSSRSTFFVGNALRRACQDAKRQLFELVAPRLAVNTDDLEVKEGKVQVKGVPQKSISISDLVTASGIVPEVGEILGKGYFNVKSLPEDETGQTEKWVAFYSYGAHGVEIAVNVKTGEVKVLRAAGCFDMGQPINPKMCEQQIDGGMAWGISHAILEQIIVGDNGKILNPNFTDYKLASVGDIPTRENIKSMIATAPHKEGPYGAKGMGEMVSLPMLAAVGNAFYNATGVRIRDLPLTPERVLKALGEKEASLH